MWRERQQGGMEGQDYIWEKALVMIRNLLPMFFFADAIHDHEGWSIGAHPLANDFDTLGPE
jgi:hypothetical protein